MLSVEILKNTAEKLPHEKRGMPFISVHLLYNRSCFHLQYLVFFCFSYAVELVYVSDELQTADVCTDTLMHLLSPLALITAPDRLQTIAHSHDLGRLRLLSSGFNVGMPKLHHHA